MAGKRDADVDPRFDPVFQRGYDPAQHGRSAHRAGSASHAASASTSAQDVRPLTPTPKYEPVEPAAAPDTPDTPVVARADEVDDEPAPARANPFRVLLLLASIASVGGAALLFWRRLEEDPYGGGYGSDLASTFAYQFVDALMVPLLTGGLLGFCLWLTLGALRKGRDD